MSFITAALIGGGATLLGGYMASEGARSAANTQSQAADRAAALQKQMFDEQQRLSAPYREAGVTGQNRLMELLGLGANTGAEGYGRYSKDFGMSDFQADPGYAFRLSEGQKALDRQAAARGGLISGGALKAATRYGQDMGSQEYGNAYNRYQTNRTNQLAPLGSLMSSGQAAAAGAAANAGTYGANAGNLTMQGGQAQAAGQLGMGNTINSALGTAASAYQNQQNFNNYLANQTSQRGLYGGAALSSNPAYSQNMYGFTGSN
jgi:hypothetical protein